MFRSYCVLKIGRFTIKIEFIFALEKKQIWKHYFFTLTICWNWLMISPFDQKTCLSVCHIPIQPIPQIIPLSQLWVWISCQKFRLISVSSYLIHSLWAIPLPWWNMGMLQYQQLSCPCPSASLVVLYTHAITYSASCRINCEIMVYTGQTSKPSSIFFFFFCCGSNCWILDP